MTRDFNSYARLLTALLPRGRAWRSDDPIRQELLQGEGVELARVDARIADLLVERDTRTTTELVSEHELDYGIVSDELLVLSDRRRTLLAKLRAMGGLCPQYYIDLAAALGWTITITQYTPAWCGIAGAGDSCGDQAVIFYWRVNILGSSPNLSGLPFADGSVFADGTYSAGSQADYSAFQALLEKYKPAHTVVLFDLLGYGFSNGFSAGFNAMPPLPLIGGFSTGFSSGFSRIA